MPNCQPLDIDETLNVIRGQLKKQEWRNDTVKKSRGIHRNRVKELKAKEASKKPLVFQKYDFYLPF